MNKPFAAVDDEVGANLSLRAVRIQGTYLNDSVRLFKFIAQLRISMAMTFARGSAAFRKILLEYKSSFVIAIDTIILSAV